MVPKESGFTLSATASCLCARTLWRFLCSSATARDGKPIQMSHSCHHVETIRYPNSTYVTTNCTERLHVDATITRSFQTELF